MAQASLEDAEKIMALGNGEIVDFRRSARLIRALEDSKATYESLEMRMRAWSHNRTFSSMLLKTAEKDTIFAKLARGLVTAGLTAIAVKYLGGIDTQTMMDAATKLSPAFLVPALGAIAAGVKGYAGKLTFEAALQIPRLMDFASYNWSLRKINNKEWFKTNIYRIEGNPFFNFDDLHQYCRDIAKEVQPAKQTDAMKKAAEDSHQLDFWAKDLAIKIAEAASSYPMNLEQATATALRKSTWATKVLSKLKIKDKTEDDPTAYGKFEYKKTYTKKDAFVDKLNLTDLDLFEGDGPILSSAAVKNRVTSISARFENSLNKNELMFHLLSGSSLATALTTIGVVGNLTVAATAGSPLARDAALFLGKFMSTAPAIMIGASALQAPMHFAKMTDEYTLLAYKAQNHLELFRTRRLQENWSDPFTDHSLAELRKLTESTLDSWRLLQGIDNPKPTSDIEKLERDLLIEKILNQSLQYKLQQPRLPLDTLIKGLVHEKAFERTAENLESLGQQAPSTPTFKIKNNVTMLDDVRQAQEAQALGDQPKAKSLSM
jgi:hypothetical protein